MESVNKELSEKLYGKIDDCLWLNDTQQKLVKLLVENFFDDINKVYYEPSAKCKPCWRCHGTGTNESMS